MKVNQLSFILQTLSKSEFSQFGNFIKSPYFNNRSEVIRFYESIKKYYPDFNFSVKVRESVFQEVYPGKKFSDVLMRKLFSLTANYLIEFIAVNSFRENKLEFNVKVIDKLRERQIPHLFEKRSGQLSRLLESSIHDISYYESKLKYTSILNGYLLNTDEKSMLGKMQNELDDVLNYFLTVILLQYIRMSEWSKSMNVKFEMKFYDEVIKYFSSQSGGEVTLPYLYFNMYMLLNTEDDKYYRDLKNGRNKFAGRLSGLDEYNIAIVSNQYCFKKVMKGYTEYRQHQFEITKNILEKNLIPAGYIEPYFFTNIVRNAVSIKELYWAEKFILDYKERLNPEIAAEIIDYSLAMTEFGKCNFEKSLEYLSKINIDISNIKLDIKNLQILNYFELNYKLELESLIDSYKHFLQRDKSLTPQSKNVSSLLIYFVSELIKIGRVRKKKDLNVLKKEIENTPYFGFKEWLLNKADDIGS